MHDDEFMKFRHNREIVVFSLSAIFRALTIITLQTEIDITINPQRKDYSKTIADTDCYKGKL